MKKLLLLLLVIGVVALAVGYYFVPHQMPGFLKPERRACQRLSSLCETEAAAECASALSELRDRMGDEAVRKPIQCTMEAKSCAEAAGCMGAAGINAAVKSVGEFLKGLGKAVAP
jgi:hypothetical protein